MSIENVQNFYNLTFSSTEIQAQLIDKDLNDFILISINIARKYGFEFTEEEMRRTIKGIPSHNSDVSINFDTDWVQKIMDIGWIPKGYSR